MPKRKKVITVNDKIQKNYRYELTESAGKNFDPKFRPELTPKKCLLSEFLGVGM